MSMYTRIVARNLQPGDVIVSTYNGKHYNVTGVDFTSAYMVKVTAPEATQTMVFGPGDRVRIAKRPRR